jgi:hypothetical protein
VAVQADLFVELLDQVLAKEPENAQAHLKLVEIYSAFNFSDPIKLRGWYIRGGGVDDGKGGRQRALVIMSGGGGTRIAAISGWTRSAQQHVSSYEPYSNQRLWGTATGTRRILRARRSDASARRCSGSAPEGRAL